MRTEVRIGNLVTDEFYDTFKKEIIVDSINQEGINLTAGDNGKPYGMHQGTIKVEYEFEKLRGIPLTEDWLKRFGFELEIASTWSSGEERRFNVYRKNRFTYNQIQSCWWYFGIILDKQPEFVHQLQNLYFALTGTELKLN